jgi:hypothetical protein
VFAERNLWSHKTHSYFFLYRSHGGTKFIVLQPNSSLNYWFSKREI